MSSIDRIQRLVSEAESYSMSQQLASVIWDGGSQEKRISKELEELKYIANKRIFQLENKENKSMQNKEAYAMFCEEFNTTLQRIVGASGEIDIYTAQDRFERLKKSIPIIEHLKAHPIKDKIYELTHNNPYDFGKGPNCETAENYEFIINLMSNLGVTKIGREIVQEGDKSVIRLKDINLSLYEIFKEFYEEEYLEKEYVKKYVNTSDNSSDSEMSC